MTYKLVFSDVDGTLLNSQHGLSETTKKAVQSVINKGIPFILGTGRQPSSARLINQELGIHMPVIGFSGALIWDENNQPIWQRGLSVKTAMEIKQRVLDNYKDVICSVYSETNWIVDDENHPDIIFEKGVVKAIPTQGNATDVLADDAIIHKLLVTGDSDILDTIQSDFAPLYPACRIYKSSPRYLEIMNREAAKSLAAEVLCRAYNISPEHVIAFGDNYNDIDMLEFAGLGVAMGNAPDDVKKSADLIAETNDNNGVAIVLNEKLIDAK